MISVESQSCRRVVQTGESVVQQYPEGTRVGTVVEFWVRTVVRYVAQDDMTVTPHIYQVPGTVAVRYLVPCLWYIYHRSYRYVPVPYGRIVSCNLHSR